VCNQAATVERYPLTCIWARFVGWPKHLLAPVIRHARGNLVLPHRLIVQRESYALMFRQSEWLEWAKQSLLVNGLKLAHHNFSIVAAQISQRAVARIVQGYRFYIA